VEIDYRTKLAWALAGYLQSIKYEITHLLRPNPVRLAAPPPCDGYPPDLIAVSPDDERSLGLAITPEDMDDRGIRTVLVSFASRYDTKTKKPVEFFIGIPNDDVLAQRIKNHFKMQGVDKQISNVKIVRLELGTKEEFRIKSESETEIPE